MHIPIRNLSKDELEARNSPSPRRVTEGHGLRHLLGMRTIHQGPQRHDGDLVSYKARLKRQFSDNQTDNTNIKIGIAVGVILGVFIVGMLAFLYMYRFSIRFSYDTRRHVTSSRSSKGSDKADKSPPPQAPAAPEGGEAAESGNA